jgi:hypothetical protein
MQVLHPPNPSTHTHFFFTQHLRRRYLKSMSITYIWLIISILWIQLVRGQIISGTEFDTCKNAAIMPVSSLSYVYDINKRELNMNASGTLAGDIMGFYGTEWTRMYLVLDAPGTTKSIHIDRVCKILNECPAPDGKVSSGTSWQLQTVSLDKPILC